MLCILTIPTVGAHYCLADATVVMKSTKLLTHPLTPTRSHSLSLAPTQSRSQSLSVIFAGSFGSLVIGLLIVDAALIEN